MSKREQLLSVWKDHANIGYVPCVYTDFDFVFEPKCTKERPIGQDGYDWFGVHWTFEPLTRAAMVTVNHPHVITDITKWEEQVQFPDLSQFDWEAIGAEETANWDRENKVSMVQLINGVFERSHHLMGFENALMAMYEEPEAYRALINRLADFKCELVRLICKHYQPDILMMHDDYGANDRLLMSVDLWREFFKEPLTRIVATVHECGAAYEHHSCGHVEPIIADLIEIGVDALDPLQRPCNDIVKLKKEYSGKITFVGGFSSQAVLENPSSTLEDIESDIQFAYDTLAPGGGYVVIPVVIDPMKIAPILMKKHFQLAGNY